MLRIFQEKEQITEANTELVEYFVGKTKVGKEKIIDVVVMLFSDGDWAAVPAGEKIFDNVLDKNRIRYGMDQDQVLEILKANA